MIASLLNSFYKHHWQNGSEASPIRERLFINENSNDYSIAIRPDLWQIEATLKHKVGGTYTEIIEVGAIFQKSSYFTNDWELLYNNC